MYHFSLTDLHVLAMPINRFWLLNRSLERIIAENELVYARASSTAQMNQESLDRYYASVRTRTGGSPIVAFDEMPDEEGTNKLKRLSQMMNKKK